jgi:integrase
MIKNSWWVDFRANHTRYRKRSPENTRAGAKAYEAALRQKLVRGELIVSGSPLLEPTFGEFAARWVNDYVRSNNKYSEQLSKKYILNASLLPFFGRMRVGQIRTHDIERYKAQQIQQGYTTKTITNRLTVLNKCLLTAYEWLELEKAPPKIKWPKKVMPEIDYLSPEECEFLLSQAKDQMRELVLTALRTGMRQGELRGLQWSSIDWLTRTLTVRHSYDDRGKILSTPKNNRARYIPLDHDVYTMLYRRKKDTGYVFLGSEGRRFTNYRMHYAIRKLCREAGFRTIGWHTLRHSFASHLALRGVPLPAIKELMGHSSIMTTMRYAHVAPSTLRAAIDMLNPEGVPVDFGQPVGNQWQDIQKSGVHEKARRAEFA